MNALSRPEEAGQCEAPVRDRFAKLLAVNARRTRDSSRGHAGLEFDEAPGLHFRSLSHEAEVSMPPVASLPIA